MAHKNRIRDHIAAEAAKIMLEEGVRGFQAAKLKAAARLGHPDTRQMPRNSEVEAAMLAHQRLFRPDHQAHELRHLRQAAVRAMELLAAFQPRLVGPALRGVVDPYARVHLHLFADVPEDVMMFLLGRQIPFEADERLLRFAGDVRENFPVYRFLAGAVAVELTVFSRTGLREAPLSPVDGRPMWRAGIERVRELLEAD